MYFSTELTAEERKARELLARGAAGSPAETLVCHVFRAMWVNSLDAESVVRIGTAMFSVSYGEQDIRDALTKLTRAKVLRSRTANGRRLYEVNY